MASRPADHDSRSKLKSSLGALAYSRAALLAPLQIAAACGLRCHVTSRVAPDPRRIKDNSRSSSLARAACSRFIALSRSLLTIARTDRRRPTVAWKRLKRREFSRNLSRGGGGFPHPPLTPGMHKIALRSLREEIAQRRLDFSAPSSFLSLFSRDSASSIDVPICLVLMRVALAQRF